MAQITKEQAAIELAIYLTAENLRDAIHAIPNKSIAKQEVLSLLTSTVRMALMINDPAITKLRLRSFM